MTQFLLPEGLQRSWTKAFANRAFDILQSTNVEPNFTAGLE